MVYLLANTGERGPGVFLGLECEADADYFERVGEEHGGYTRYGTREESADNRLLGGRCDEESPCLFVCNKLNGGVGEDTEECCRVSSEETLHAILSVYIFHGGYDAEPGAGIFCELGARGLKKNFNPVKGADNCFGLE